MNYYLDITINNNKILNAVYTKFHTILWNKKKKNIGVSFPRYNITLGNTMRIHGDVEQLIDLLNTGWLEGYNISEVQKIPSDAKHRIISRKQPKMTNSKLRRLIKRGNIPKNEINVYKAIMYRQGLDNPYLELKSGSNGHKYRKFLKFGEVQDAPIKGDFDSFGLSKDGTVPWF